MNFLQIFKRNKLLMTCFGLFELSVYAAIVVAFMFPNPATVVLAVVGVTGLLTVFAVIREFLNQGAAESCCRDENY